MAKKVLRSDLEITGIAPNLLLKDVENTAPFLFKGEISTEGSERAYLAKLVFYKKNLNALKYLGLSDYFYLCMASHWATAGTFVPTNVDNQIREGLWKHKQISGHIERMARITIDSWSWNYEQVTNRKAYNPKSSQILSTHEGTWLSVAIGAYCALVKHKKTQLAQEMADVILSEIDKEQKLLIELREGRDHINFLRSTALMAHNFGDLDRVIDQWEMPDHDLFKQKIYKLGHQVNENFSKIFVYAGQVNKTFLAVENHRHMSMRQARSLRLSYKFLIPIGPFMDSWGETLGQSDKLTLMDKSEIVNCFFEGYKRQNQANGYARAFSGMIRCFERGLDSLEVEMPYDLMAEIKKSPFFKIANLSRDEIEADYKKRLEDFICPVTNIRF